VKARLLATLLLLVALGRRVMGWPAYAWAALVDACPATDRARLLHPYHRTAGDFCDAYEGGAPDGRGDCETDGHYLCAGCRCMSRAAMERHGLQVEDACA